MAKKEKLIFNISKLQELSLRRLEGEVDGNIGQGALNYNTFVKTDSIRKYLNNFHGYVLSGKGAGKSALFVALKEKLFDKTEIDYSVNDFIFVDDSFGIDDEFLNNKTGANIKYKYTITWAFYIIHKTITHILYTHEESDALKTFKAKIRHIEGFKNKYELFQIIDYVNQFRLKVLFKIQGQKISIDPTIKTKDKKRNLNINELITFIDDYYRQIGKRLHILIDRIDNFVTREKYELQRDYVQGLITLIEEIVRLNNVNITLFLRTDLFKSLSIDIEYDKTKDRLLFLRWSHSEILQFVVRRWLNNEYIEKNYKPFFENCYYNIYIQETVDNFFLRFLKRYKRMEVQEYDLTTDFARRVMQSFLLLFFPRNIHHKKAVEGKKLQEIDFFKWFFSHLRDKNDYINPRTIIHFFNLLFEEQYYEYENNPDKTGFNYVLELKKINGDESFELFHSKIINKVFYITQNDELKNIYALLKRADKTVFRQINTVSYKTGTFKYSQIKLPKNYKPETYNRLLKYLSLLGFLSLENEKGNDKKYNVPILFQKKMNYEKQY